MRPVPQTSGSLTARAIAGSRVVLFGFNVKPPLPDNLLGFAVRRTDVLSGRSEWLPNFVRFAVNDGPDGPTGSDKNPLQAFQWGDYAVRPGQQLKYRVVSIVGTPDDPKELDSVELDVTCEAESSGTHRVFFNRGVAGSQAYTRNFGDVSPLRSADARAWMSRGLEEALLQFIGQANGPEWGLRGAFYEFIHKPVLAALHGAARSGADVALAISCPSVGGWPDYPSWDNIEAIRALPGSRKAPPYKGLASYVRPRTRSKDIAHNKFLVLLKNGAPQAVWTGSTNITDGALYGHSNVGHLVADPEVAATFLDYWEELFADEDGDKLTDFDEQHTPLETIGEPGCRALFSPRRGTAALDRYAEFISKAKQSVFVTAPFGLAMQLREAMAAASDIPHYVLADSDDPKVWEILRGDDDNHIAAGAFIKSQGGWHQFLQERLTGLNSHVKYIHTKYLLIDPLTDDPLVVTGSANFSENSTVKNDENMLAIRGDTRVADIYLSEFMRLFTHMRFRGSVVGRDSESRAPDPAEPDIKSPLHLAEDARWAAEYYKPSTAKSRERELFSGVR